jgi:hypothetical protein
MTVQQKQAPDLRGRALRKVPTSFQAAENVSFHHELHQKEPNNHEYE